MATFREVISDPSVGEVHYQPRKQFLPMTSEHGAFQADLCFFDEYAKQSRGYNGLLCVINMASRYGYAVEWYAANVNRRPANAATTDQRYIRSTNAISHAHHQR